MTIRSWLMPPRARWLFWLALAGVTLLALMPGDEVPISTGWDKSNHVLAFFVLTLLAGLSWPQARWFVPVLGLIGYGIGIEAVQHLVGRDAAIADVFADTIGIAVGRVSMQLSVLRRVATTS
jgi:VanZ family protein